MIAKLSGLVDSLGDDWVVIDVGGVGYMVFCSSRTLGLLGVGEATQLVIETHVREDHIHLYGFSDSAERDWFKLLTTVQGVGAKVGLGILSTLSSDELVQAIAAADKGAVCRANGVGPKLGTRIVTELKDKVGHMALGQAALAGALLSGAAPAASGTVRSQISDAVSALVNLGYSPSDALSAVSRGAANLEENATVEVLIRVGLSELGPADLGAR
ncbi:MAG: Holliday junction branch migration protein RuvA [Rhodospirillales bacterium]|jgi:holliday junction DNA helicase RuvA|nr:Holliday junction branch migration protein RuvA [Rhodospirillales bacterium]MBT4039070.1 Holliday junction branch migration protein RuvA [Rhodospirillales bacterium]MBT4627897.1 Holliday junction branch migration protein RuvA [Rhodospirillales bacterium]MBT5353302.1 Holliday junction branch migration protein RuvA [Rhodospirillales bacterium]MBT5521618.1 Holliday junction branch migration protein RuvA [Rhodospirillales bacterium]